MPAGLLRRSGASLTGNDDTALPSLPPLQPWAGNAIKAMSRLTICPLVKCNSDLFDGRAELLGTGSR